MRILIFLLFLFSFIFAGRFEASKLMTRGNELYSEGRYNGAKILYERALENGANPTVCLFNIGNCYYRMDSTGRAIVNFKKASTLAPEFPKPLFNLAGIFQQMGDYGKAIVYYKKVLELEPENTRAKTFLGDCYTSVGNYASALRYYEEVLKAKEENINIIYTIAEIYIEIGDWENAVGAIKSGINLYPSKAELYFYLGDIFMVREDPSKAVFHYQQGLSADYERPDIFLKMAEAAVLEDNLFVAAGYLRKAGAMKKASERVFSFLGDIYFELGWMEKSGEAYEKAAEKGSYDALRGIHNIAYHFFNEGDYEKALSMYNLILNFRPGNRRVLDDIKETKELMG
ncbi:MAG: tetratricopeptide repeat protein [Fibrobacterota bacterium]